MCMWITRTERVGRRLDPFLNMDVDDKAEAAAGNANWAMAR